MTLNELKSAIAAEHKPELSKKPGMVWQIWEDGELTLQKSGELLWQRNLHCILPGFTHEHLPKETMPVVETEHGYAFIESEKVGLELRAKMTDYWQSVAGIDGDK